jgi:hypothetical protein
VDQLGKNASSGAKEALKTLVKVLEDGVIKPDELAKITEVLARVRGSRELSDKAVFEGFEGLQKADEAVVEQIKPVLEGVGRTLDAVQQMQTLQGGQASQISEIFRQLETLGRQVQTPSSYW